MFFPFFRSIYIGILINSQRHKWAGLATIFRFNYNYKNELYLEYHEGGLDERR